jgi:hypothetical protein
MNTINSINAGSIASVADVLAGTSDKNLVTPLSYQGAFDVSRTQLPWYENLSMNYAGGVFTIASADGSPLSSSNKARVALSSNQNPGRVLVHEIDQNQFFEDASGTSDLVNNLFGASSGIDWDQELPFFVYFAVRQADDSGGAFFISRIPHRTSLPATAHIGYKTAANANSPWSVWCLRPGIDPNDYQGAACVALGSFRMAGKSVADDWTVQGFNSSDGFGLFRDAQGFSMPYGQQGAVGYVLPYTGTAPDFGIQNTISYSLQKNGLIFVSVITVNFVGGTGGSGSEDFELTMPLPCLGFQFPAPGTVLANGVDYLTANPRMVLFLLVESNSVAKLSPGVGGNFYMTLNDFSADVRVISGSVQYPVSIG